MTSSTTVLSPKLRADDVANYWSNGFVFPIRAMSEEAAAEARAELEAFEKAWLTADLPHPLSTFKRVNAQLVMPLVARIASDSNILDAVEAVIGPDVMLYAAELFIKEAKTPHVVTMHQDLTYWGLGAIDGMVTAWLALSPATPASGCMDFVGGSHKNEILPHVDSFAESNLLSRGQEVQVDVADDDKTAIILRPGEFSLHHGLTIHGSGPNVSDDRRIGVVMRFLSPEIKQLDADQDYATLQRGEDRFGNFAHVPLATSAFAPDALAVLEKVRTARAQALMKDAKKKSAAYGVN